MGLDGGTKITRSDVLRRQSSRWAQQDTSRSTRGGSISQVYQEVQIDEQIRRTIIWTTCALSGLPLVAPVVADALGQLFNKQAVLEHLLAAKAAAAAAAAGSADTAAADVAGAPLALPAAGAPLAAAVNTAALVRSSAAATGGAMVPISAAGGAAAAAAAEPPKELAAACLRYENQQRAAAAAAAAGGDAATAAQGTFEHIKSLKDVFVVQLTPNPDAGITLASGAAAAGGSAVPRSVYEQQSHGNSQHASSSSDLPSPWMCPVTLQPCGSKQPCCAIRTCGHVLSQKALAAIAPPVKGGPAGSTQAAGKSSRHHSKSSTNNSTKTGRLLADGSLADGVDDVDDELEGVSDCCCCPVCEEPYDADRHVVLIGGSQQHIDSVRARLREAAAAKALSKQHKKRKRAAADAVCAAGGP